MSSRQFVHVPCPNRVCMGTGWLTVNPPHVICPDCMGSCCVLEEVFEFTWPTNVGGLHRLMNDVTKGLRHE